MGKVGEAYWVCSLRISRKPDSSFARSYTSPNYFTINKLFAQRLAGQGKTDISSSGDSSATHETCACQASLTTSS
jgi:hypothetical protein